jgi:hypothetical protein
MSGLPPLPAVACARLIRELGRLVLTNFPTTQAGVRVTIALLVLIFAIGMEQVSLAQSGAIDLSHQNIGAPPDQFAFWRGGRVDAGHWAVVDDSKSLDGTAIQRSDADRSTQAALAVYNPVSVLNARVRTQFRLITGSTPSAGIALRVTSPDDYYVVRTSEDDQRICLFRIAGGVSEEIAGVDADIIRDHWQTLEVTAKDNEFTIWLDDELVLTVFDDSKMVAGQFGIWTERDDVTRFNQVEITPITVDYWHFEPQNRPGG